ncbi:MAG: hypothetical protein NVS2B7_37190 [Herpetosiphon sp.]
MACLCKLASIDGGEQATCVHWYATGGTVQKGAAYLVIGVTVVWGCSCSAPASGALLIATATIVLLRLELLKALACG